MNEELKQRLHELAPEVPDTVPVHRLLRLSPDQLRDQAAAMLKPLGQQSDRRSHGQRWEESKGRSRLLLNEGGRLIVHHASGAVTYRSGLDPAADAFPTEDDPRHLRAVAEKTVASVASQLPLDRWVADRGRLEPERVWRIMGAGTDAKGTTSSATMFRAVGAYRHLIDDIAVWGPASVALHVTASHKVDGLSTLIRRPDGEVLDKVPVTPVDHGIEALVSRLEALMGGSRASLDEVARPQWLRFGYLSLSKRQGQRTLEPAYLALIDIETEDAHGYLVTIPASPKVFDPICRPGQLSLTIDHRQPVA